MSFKMNFKSLLVLACLIGFNGPLNAAVTPISVSIVPPVQFPPADFTVAGIRANILVGSHRDMYGLDVSGVGSITQQNFTGIALAGIFNWTQGKANVLGLQFAGITNLNSKELKLFGLQLSAVNINLAASEIFGFQLGLVNQSAFTKVYGVQAGIYNKALEVYGFQIGLVNVAKSLHGIQLGLLNINDDGPFVMAPILNVGF